MQRTDHSLTVTSHTSGTPLRNHSSQQNCTCGLPSITSSVQPTQCISCAFPVHFLLFVSFLTPRIRERFTQLSVYHITRRKCILHYTSSSTSSSSTTAFTGALTGKWCSSSSAISAAALTLSISSNSTCSSAAPP